MNTVIVDEFTKLVAFIEYKINEFKETNNKKEVNINNFRLRQIKNVLKILKNYQDKINKENYKELINIDGIGKGTIERIKEIQAK